MKKFGRFLKKRLSFHVMDVIGMIAAALLITTHPDTQDLFYTLGDPTLYLSLLLVAFLGRSLYWLVILPETFDRRFFCRLHSIGFGYFVCNRRLFVCFRRAVENHFEFLLKTVCRKRSGVNTLFGFFIQRRIAVLAFFDECGRQCF